MISFKQILAVIILIMLSSNAYAVIYSRWISPSLYGYHPHVNISIDRDSINRHNDSLYYAFKYHRAHSSLDIDLCRVVIIQSKKYAAGIVQVYECKKYDKIQYDSENNPHPAYTAKEASKLKELDKDSLIYQVDKYIRDNVLEKMHSKDLYL